MKEETHQKTLKGKIKQYFCNNTLFFSSFFGSIISIVLLPYNSASAALHLWAWFLPCWDQPVLTSPVVHGCHKVILIGLPRRGGCLWEISLLQDGVKATPSTITSSSTESMTWVQGTQHCHVISRAAEKLLIYFFGMFSVRKASNGHWIMESIGGNITSLCLTGIYLTSSFFVSIKHSIIGFWLILKSCGNCAEGIGLIPEVDYNGS